MYMIFVMVEYIQWAAVEDYVCAIGDTKSHFFK